MGTMTEESVVGNLGPAVTVDPEFWALIPPVTEGERAALEASLLADGCRDPLVVWKGHNTLLDGHTRLKVCQQYQIKYRTAEKELPDRDAAKEWIVQNQLGRRNLTSFGRAELVAHLEPMIAAKAKENQRGCLKSDKPLDTKAEMARRAKMSPATWCQAKALIAGASDDVKRKLRSEVITINGAYNQLVGHPRPKRPKRPKQSTRLVSKYDGKVIRMPGDKVVHLRAAVMGRWDHGGGWAEVNPEKLLQEGGKYEDATERTKRFAMPKTTDQHAMRE